jgi:hypothetical protein
MFSAHKKSTKLMPGFKEWWKYWKDGLEKIIPSFAE